MTSFGRFVLIADLRNRGDWQSGGPHGTLQGTMDASEPTTLTQTKADAICELVAKGRYPATAASLLGIPKRTWARWSTEGKQALAEAEDGAELGSLASLALGIEAAEAQHIDGRLSRIDEAGAKSQHWTANGWDLERRYGDLYGKHEREGQAPAVVFNFPELPPGSIKALLDMAQAEATAPVPKSPMAGSERLLSSPAPQHPDSD